MVVQQQQQQRRWKIGIPSKCLFFFPWTWRKRNWLKIFFPVHCNNNSNNNNKWLGYFNHVPQWLTLTLLDEKKKSTKQWEQNELCVAKQSVYKNKFDDLKSCIFINIPRFFLFPSHSICLFIISIRGWRTMNLWIHALTHIIFIESMVVKLNFTYTIYNRR